MMEADIVDDLREKLMDKREDTMSHVCDYHGGVDTIEEYKYYKGRMDALALAMEILNEVEQKYLED